jgi:hypothetical protein
MSERALSLGGAAAVVKLELTRCQRHVSRGGSPGFWLWRLRPVLNSLEELASTVRMRIEQLEQLERTAIEIELELERGAREASVTLKAGEDA